MKKQEIIKLAYTAGIMDGEGSVFLFKSKPKGKCFFQYWLTVRISNTNEWLIHWLKFNYGGNINISKSPKHPEWAMCFRWELHGEKAAEFLASIIPFLYLKKPQAEIALKFRDSIKVTHKNLTEEELAVREAQYITMRSYNQKGRATKT